MSFAMTALVGATIPFFARRFGKFLPADAGTALARLWHRPRRVVTKNEQRRFKRAHLQGTLVFAALFWGAFLCGAHYCLKLFSLSSYYLVFCYTGALLAMIDEKIRLLPDVLTVPLLMFGFMGAAFGMTDVSSQASVVGALAGFALPTIAGFVMTPFRPRAMGGGDFKTLAAFGAWLGFIGISVTILLSFFYFALIALYKRKKEGPYGLALFLGALTALVLQAIYSVDLLFVVG